MQRFDLGGQGSNRDTLSAAIQSQYSPLENTLKAAQVGQEQGFGSMFGSQLNREKIAGTLGMNMALADQRAAYQAQGEEEAMRMAEEEAAAKEQGASDELGGQEQAIIDHYQNVLDAYEPGSPEYEGAKRALETMQSSMRGSLSHRLGYLKGIGQNNFADPFAQGTLGMEAARPVSPQEDARDEEPVRQVIPGWEGLDDELND